MFVAMYVDGSASLELLETLEVLFVAMDVDAFTTLELLNS